MPNWSLVRRPEEVRIAIFMEESRQKPPFQFASDRGRVLFITEVSEGPITEWNTANPEQEVQRGDRVVAVNGQRGSGKELLEALQASSSPKLVLTIVRQVRAEPEEPDDEGA